jgi:hypothetical protein
VSLGPVIVNGMYPELAGVSADPVAAARDAGAALRPGEADLLAAAATFRRDRTALQDEQVHRLADQLPLPQLTLPFLFSADLGPPDLAVLSDAVTAGIESLPESAVQSVPDAGGD